MTRYDTFSDISCVTSDKKTVSSGALSLSMMVEEVLNWLYSKKGVGFFQEGLERFQKEQGVVLCHESCYHQRLTYFNYYFLFRMQSTESQRPIDCYFENSSPELQERVSGLSEPVFSIFRLVKANKNVTILKDLLHKKRKYRIQNERVMMEYIARHSIIQGFLFDCQSRFVLGNGFLIHPAHILKPLIKRIKHEAKEGLSSHDRCLTKLSLAHLHYSRNSKINLSLTYKFLYSKT